MVLNLNVINKVEAFMIPYRKREKVLNQNAYNVDVATAYGLTAIAEGLADAITDYEKVDRTRDYEYNSSAEELLKWISYVDAYNALSDNKSEQALKDCTEKCTSLESKLNENKTTIAGLEHKITELKTTIRIFQNVHPDLKVAIQESELEDGESSSV